MARTKGKEEIRPDPVQGSVSQFAAFDTLMTTAAVDSQIQALAESGADPTTLNTALTAALAQAQARWGLGLLHLKHQAQLVQGGDQNDIALLADGRQVALISEGYASIASAYQPMRAVDERGLSLWGVLPDGYRAAAELPSASLKILIEEARDFETHWATGRSNTFQRTWRKGDTLFAEIARPASAEAALSDAAWDVITSIKDRSFQRELMRRSEEVGMLGALLAARHAGAKANLDRLPEAHFTVQSVVSTLGGTEGRSAEAYRAMLKNALSELEEYQSLTTRQLSEVLKHGLTAR